jgi:recombination protein RecA
VIELATLSKIFIRSGTWYAYQEEKIGQGKEQVRQWLQQNPEKTQQIITLLKTEMNFNN